MSEKIKCLQRAFLVTGLGVSILAANGCTVAQEVTETNSTSSYQPDAERPFDIDVQVVSSLETVENEYQGLPTGPCYQSFVTTEFLAGAFADTAEGLQSAQEDAADCVAGYAGSVALVYFEHSVTLQQAEELAEDTQTILEYMSDGLLAVTVEPVRATPAAELAHRKRMSDTPCALNNNAAHFGSVAADTTMPVLREYDMIIGVVDEVFCPDEGKTVSGTTGVADTGKMRHVDVSAGALKEFEGTDEENRQRIAFTTGHEMGHLLRLGHHASFGALEITHSQGPTSEPVDLDAFFARKSYSEYTDSIGSIMGGNATMSAENAWLTGIGISRLDEPVIYADSQKPSMQELEMQATEVITVTEAQKNNLVRMPLTEDVVLQDEVINSSSEFDSLVIDPCSSGETEQKDGTITPESVNCAEIYLFDTHSGDHVLASLVNADTSEKTVQAFQIGSDTLTLTFTDTELQLAKG